MRLASTLALALGLCVCLFAATASADVRLTNDDPGLSGYVANYRLVHPASTYTDPAMNECSRSRGRQNEPSVAIDPRDPSVLVGSSNDYCAVYDANGSDGFPSALGPIWLGYYRSTDSGSSFTSSLVPGYPGDSSPYAARAQIRTASSGDPVEAWDGHGRLFMASETSDDPAGSPKGYGDEFVATFVNPHASGQPTSDDGLEFARSVTVAKGAAAPNYNGKFNDKTAIEADRTGGSCDGNVYFAWSAYNGKGGNTIYFSRSTDHGATFSNQLNLGPVNSEIQFPDISVTSGGNVYVTFEREADGKQYPDGSVLVVKSTNCGKTFSPPKQVVSFTPFVATDVAAPQTPTQPLSGRDDPLGSDSTAAKGSLNRDCGVLDSACADGYVFFRHDTQVRSTADQSDAGHEWIYIVYDPSKPNSLVPTYPGDSYYSVKPGWGSQAGIYFVRYNGATGQHSTPALIDSEPSGQQIFPDISAGGGTLHAIWWDSRDDANYDPARPIGNSALRTVDPALETWAATSADNGDSWTPTTSAISAQATNPDWMQFSNRTVPFAGDYLWVDSQGSNTFAVWTDWRDTVGGTDPRVPVPPAYGNDAAHGSVVQCRVSTSSGTWSSDHCPRDGGIDQNIYGGEAP